MKPYNLPRSPSAHASRRNADLQYQHRLKHKQRLRRDRRRTAFATMKKRCKIVRDYHGRRHTALTEAEAASQTAARFGIGASSLRRFYRLWRKGGKRTLLPCYKRLNPARTPLPFDLVEIILVLRARLGWCKGAACHWRWLEIEAEAGSFQGWYNFYRGHGALGYRVPAALYAGISLDKQGLENVFGLLPESAVVVEDLPVITQANRMDRLSLALTV